MNKSAPFSYCPLSNSNTNIITIRPRAGLINHMILLSDGRIASATNDGSIQIIDYLKEKIDYSISASNIGGVYYLKEISKNILLCVTKPGMIKSFLLNKISFSKGFHIKEAHKDRINMIVNLPNHFYATCSDDCDIKIWSSNTLRGTISNKNVMVNGIVYLQNNIIVSANEDSTVSFYSLDTLRLVHVIKNVISHTGGIYLSTTNKLLIGFSETITVINPSTYQIETVLIVSFLFGFNSIVEYNTNKFLCASNVNICELDITKGKIKQPYNTLHNSKINCIISLGNNTFATGGNDREIKIWRYNNTL